MKRQVSGPTLELIRLSGLTPDDVDHALENLVRAKAAAVLRTHHAIVERIQQATNIHVVQIARRSRCLLIVVEQQRDGKPSWQYREQTQRRCIFSCRGRLPDTIEVALNGALLEKLVKPAMVMTGTIIENVEGTIDGWLEVDVVPTWHSF